MNEEVNSELIDLNISQDSESSPNYGQGYSEKRALMTNVASGNEISINDAYSRIINGQEQQTQKYLANREELKHNQTKTELLTQFIKSKEGGQVAPEEIDAIRGLASQDLQSKEALSVALERNFSKAILNRQIASGQGSYSAYTQATQTNPEAVDGLLKAAEDHITKARLAEAHVERIKHQAEGQSWGGWGADKLKDFIPGYTWYKQRNLASGANWNDIFTGQNVEAQLQYLYSLPPVQFNTEIGRIVDTLAADNPSLAEEFARKILSYSKVQSNMDDAFSAIDLATAPTFYKDVGKLGLKVTKASFGKLLGDVTKEAANPNATAADILAAGGNLTEATAVNATKAAQIKASGMVDRLEGIKQLAELQGQSLTNPEGWMKGSSRFTSEAVAQMSKELVDTSSDLLKGVSKPWMVQRIDEGTQAMLKAVDNAFTKLETLNGPEIINGVLDQRLIPNSDNMLRTNTLVVDLGTPSKGLFETVEQADNTARQIYGLKAGDYTVTQRGGNFSLTVSRDLDETADGIKDVLIHTDNKAPESLVNMWLGKLRSADNVVSNTNRQNRKVALNAAEEVKGWLEQATKPLNEYLKGADGKLNHERLTRVLESNRQDRKWYSSVGEFEQEWYKMFNTFPSEKDVVAYNVTRQISDLDHLVRNSEVYSYKASRGISNFEVKANSNIEGAGKMYSSTFEGKVVEELPFRGEGHRVMIIDENGASRFVRPMSLADDEKKILYKQLKEEGYKFVQVFDPNSDVLRKYTIGKDNSPINFVASKEFRNSRLDPLQLPYVPGGHINYGNRVFIKQPQIVELFENDKWAGKGYRGDMTFSAHQWEKEGSQFYQDLEKARQLYASGSNQLDAFINSKFAFTPGEFRQMFSKEGFNKDTPFILVKDGENFKKANDLKSLGIQDHTDSSFNMSSEMSTKYIGEKGMDIHDFKLGSGNNPVWNPVKAVTLDPLRSVRKNMSDITNSLAFNEYKNTSANEWIEQFGDLIHANKDDLRRNPLWHFNNPNFIEGSDPVRLAAAKQSLTAVQNLMHTPSSVKASVDYTKEKLLNFIFDKNPAIANALDERLMYTTSDPIQYARGAAFHLNIGLFNPKQLFLQTQNLVNMSAISPTHSMGAYKDMVIMNMLRMTENPNVINYWAKKSGNPNFLESLSLMKESGFMNMSGNMAVLDHLAEPKLIKGKMGTALDFATVFFKEGETINRLGAWNIAFREFKEANPEKIIGAVEKRWILDRADNLTTNMTRASQAQLQQGFGSIPAQFMSYQWRLSEQILTGILGKGTLDRGEAFRLLGATSLMYGIPVGGMGAAVGVWPWHESIEQYAQEKGINLDANVITRTLSRGILEEFFKLSTGKQYDMSSFGPAGIPTFKDALTGKKSMLETLTGVSGSTVGKMYNSVAPVATSLASVFGGPDKDHPLAYEDVLDVLRSSTAINNATKAWMLYNYGTYESKTGIPITGAKGNISEAGMQIFGLNPRDLSIFYARKSVLEDQKKALTELSKGVDTEVGRALKADTKEEGEKYFQRARALMAGAGTLSPQTKNEMFISSIRKHGPDLLDEVNRKWIMNSPNNDTQNSRIKLMESQANGR